MWPFRPKHTVESVLRELVEGYYNGTVVLPDQPEQSDSGTDGDTDQPESVGVTFLARAPIRSSGRTFLGGYVPSYNQSPGRPASKTRREHGGVQQQGYMVAGGPPGRHICGNAEHR